MRGRRRLNRGTESRPSPATALCVQGGAVPAQCDHARSRLLRCTLCPCLSVGACRAAPGRRKPSSKDSTRWAPTVPLGAPRAEAAATAAEPSRSDPPHQNCRAAMAQTVAAGLAAVDRRWSDHGVQEGTRRRVDNARPARPSQRPARPRCSARRTSKLPRSQGQSCHIRRPRRSHSTPLRRSIHRRAVRVGALTRWRC